MKAVFGLIFIGTCIALNLEEIEKFKKSLDDGKSSVDFQKLEKLILTVVMFKVLNEHDVFVSSSDCDEKCSSITWNGCEMHAQDSYN